MDSWKEFADEVTAYVQEHGLDSAEAWCHVLDSVCAQPFAHHRTMKAAVGPLLQEFAEKKLAVDTAVEEVHD